MIWSVDLIKKICTSTRFDFILSFVLYVLQTNMTKVEVKIDARVHSRLIGVRGRNIRKIVEQFKVDIRFPRGTDEPDLVTIIGSDEDKITDVKEHLLLLEQEYVIYLLFLLLIIF